MTGISGWSFRIFKCALVCAIILQLFFPAGILRASADVRVMQAHEEWPVGYVQRTEAFKGAAFDGTYVWMAPYDSDRVVRIHAGDGSMSSVRFWPAGFSPVSGAFSAAVTVAGAVWLIPYNAAKMIRIDLQTLQMTVVDGWPEGFQKTMAAFDGAVVSGQIIWMVPFKADRVVGYDTSSGQWLSRLNWPSGLIRGNGAFSGAVLHQGGMYLVPADANQIVRMDLQSGSMSAFDRWPVDYAKVGAAFSGAVSDGKNIWFIPRQADRIVRLNPDTGFMIGFNNWPDGFSKTAQSFAGGYFDGRDLWLVPHSADRLISLRTDTGLMQAITAWPAGYVRKAAAFSGGIYDGNKGWLIPYNSTAVMQISANREPVAMPLSFDGQEDTTVEGTLSGTDPDGDPIQFEVTGMPAQGTFRWVDQGKGTFRYSPANDWSGSDTFTYRTNDGAAVSGEVAVRIQIRAVNDPPAIQLPSVVTAEDTEVQGKLQGIDNEKDPLTFRLVQPPLKGTWTWIDPAAGTFRYQPAQNHYGSDRVSVEVSDGVLTSGPVEIPLTIQSVDDPPVAVGAVWEGTEDVRLNQVLQGNDPEKQSLIFLITNHPAHGKVRLTDSGGNVEYVPDPGFSGEDRFEFKVSDGKNLSLPATVTIQMKEVNDPPSLVVKGYQTDEDVPLEAQLQGRDPENGIVTYALTQAPANGQFSWTDRNLGRFRYVPPANWSGSDTVRLTLTDDAGAETSENVVLLVKAVNDPPVATGRVFDVAFGQTFQGQLQLPPAEPGESLQFHTVRAPKKGAITWVDAAKGIFRYTPGLKAEGTDDFAFRIRDAQYLSDYAEVVLRIMKASPTPSPAISPSASPVSTLTPAPSATPSPSPAPQTTPAPQIIYMPMYIFVPSTTPSTTPAAPTGMRSPSPSPSALAETISPSPMTTATPAVQPAAGEKSRVEANASLAPANLAPAWLPVQPMTVKQHHVGFADLKATDPEGDPVRYQLKSSGNERYNLRLIGTRMYFEAKDHPYTLSRDGKRVSDPLGVTLTAIDSNGNQADQILLVDIINQSAAPRIALIKDQALVVPERWRANYLRSFTGKMQPYLKLIKIPVRIDLISDDPELSVSATAVPGCGLRMDGVTPSAESRPDDLSRRFWIQMAITETSTFGTCQINVYAQGKDSPEAVGSFRFYPENVEPFVYPLMPRYGLKPGKAIELPVMADDVNNDRLKYTVTGGNSRSVTLRKISNRWILQASPDVRPGVTVPFTVKVEDGRGGVHSRSFTAVIQK